MLGNLRLYAYAGLAAAAIALGLWYHHAVYQSGYKAAIAQYEKAQAIADAKHAKELQEASHANDAEIAKLKLDLVSRPIPAVRLCARPHLPGAATAADGAGARAGNVQPVPEGDSGLRAEPGPDISELLGLLALRADQVSADLREEQAVH